MNNHQCFRVRVNLLTSVRLGRFPVSLDGLLWHCLFLRSGDPELASKDLKRILSEKDGVFLASSMRFGVYPAAPLIATQQPTIGSMRSDDLLAEQFHPTGKGGKYRKIVTNGGPYKSRLEKHPTYYAPELTWDAVGDPVMVCELLNFYVFAIGLDANRGFGSIDVFRWEPLEEDSSWRDEENKPARVLPAALWESFSEPASEELITDLAQPTPPYRKSPETLCVIPSRVRRIHVPMPIQS